MTPDNILTQKNWSEEELLEAGFKYYKRRKQVVLARELPSNEAPLKIKYNNDVLIATARYMICFHAGWFKKKSLYDYFHWPVAPNHFADMYVEWDEPGWKPKRGQKHLLSLGCQPYYNAVGVWAKKLDQPQVILGVEHEAPFEVPKGAWLLIAARGSAMGAPYWNSGKGFHRHFYVD